MGFLNKAVKIGTGGLVPDITGEEAAGRASALAQQGAQAGIAEQGRQFDITQANLQPFLEAGTGALGQYQQALGQAPAAFTFDPQQALQSPALQFQQQMGQQQLDRLSGLNRQLGSGQRLIGGQQFGQGLASQSLGEEFNRQLTQQQSAENRFNTRLNRLAGLIDVGRGTGTALGQFGAQKAGNVSNLLQQQYGAQAAAELQKSAGINNLIGQGIGAAGLVLSGGAPIGGIPSFGGGSPTDEDRRFLQNPSAGPINIGFNPTGLF